MSKKLSSLALALLVGLLLVACGEAEQVKVLSVNTATTTPSSETTPTAGITPANTVAPAAAAGSSGSSVAKVGAAAPDFSLLNLDKQQISLSQFRGKPVILNFWATWCGPCKQELPFLAKTYAANKANYEIVGIDVGEEEPLVRLKVREFNLTYMNLIDRTQKVASTFQVNAFPSSFFIDKNGVVRAIKLGALDEQSLPSLLSKIVTP
ncbi:MAG TPA: TlpA disulfide reductase family protein [Chloroflexia bacterium]|nr:TlpA disulfide reductase family protein [Chloroflexia bacterium]